MVETKQKREKFTIGMDAPGRAEVLLGNEAIARGIVEGGAQVAAAYPGTPSSEIVDTLSRVAKQCDMYVEWSVNEKVAVEVAAAGAMAGLRAATSMKAQGINVALDFLSHLNLIGSGDGGMLVVVCDDPDALSGNNEQDSRWFAHMYDYPLLEPASAQEAKEMAKWAYELSEQLRSAVFMRSVTRISHSSSIVTMGEIQRLNRKAEVDVNQDFTTFPVPQKHALAKEKLGKAEEIFENSPFNWYSGPESPRLTVVCSGTGYLYALDAVDTLGVEDSVGILKLGTTWPLPVKFIEKHIKPGSVVLVIEEVDPFLETLLKERLFDRYRDGRLPIIYGKHTGHINKVGELNPDHAIRGVASVLGIKHQVRDVAYDKRAKAYAQQIAIERPLAYCPGCPHRASLWIMKNVLRRDDSGGFVNGDIGCYALDHLSGGQMISKSISAMGSASGLTSGFGKLGRFGLNQMVMTTIGDSTFFHASIPPIINAVHHKSNAIFVVLDNSVTAMTGFQPHPGSEADAVGDPAVRISIEDLCSSLGCLVEVADPFDPEDAQEKLERLAAQEGAKVLIMRRTCGLVAFREKGKVYQVWVDESLCLGEECGCGRYCNRIFKCPALIWDATNRRATIDQALCTGCGFCVNICPRGAIKREKNDGK